MLGSVITSMTISGASGQGAQHITLRHDFVSSTGTFRTDDRAVCAPAGRDSNVCRVNDVMEIVAGTGMFEHASGQLVNHGTIDLNTFTMSYSMRGRACGDGCRRSYADAVSTPRVPDERPMRNGQVARTFT